MSEYNPPPWHVTDDEYDDTVKAIVDDFNTPVAHVPKWAEEEDTAAAAAANARLIAASPDLLAACKFYLAMRAKPFAEQLELASKCSCMMIDAVRKATGNQKVIDLDPA